MIDPDGGLAEPLVEGLAYFSDDTGEYWWNEGNGNYDTWNSEEGWTTWTWNQYIEPVGDYFINFDFKQVAGDLEGEVKDVYNPGHTIKELAAPLYAYLKSKGDIQSLTDNEKYPGVVILSSKNMNGAITLGNVIFTNSTTQIADISTISDLQYFGLRFHVENISGSKEPDHTMSQTYKYNSLNWLLEAESPDEGLSKFVYRNDGQIRFSQNARQVSQGRFSYTNYDKYARPIESGEYKGQIGGYIFTDHYGNGGSGNVSTDAIREVTGGFAAYGGNCSGCIDRSYIYYDLARTDVPVIPGHQNSKQTFINGNIAKTENAKTATWYSYDHYGRMTWMIKGYDLNIQGTMPIYKLWEYDYDSKGNVAQVTYQPYGNDYFAHFYDYDDAGRLQRVYTNTSSNASLKIKQAEYIYYAHGPLKRVELANNLQGVDYVYTINGALKSINNPDPNYDLGQDGIGNTTFHRDQFAMTLDYFGGDYNRTCSGISNANDDNWNPSTPYPIESNYSGSIATQHWNRREGGTSAMDQYQNTYVYKYDAFNQLNNAIYGSFKPKPVGSVQSDVLTLSNNFKVSDITYDKNGNLETLKRRNSTGGLEDDLAYSYKVDINTGQRTNKLDKVDGAELQNQNGNNYRYDASGRLVEDVKEKLLYEYNTQGLVIGLKSTQSGYYLVKFYYDDAGFRYKKEEFDSNEDVNKTTLYVRDLSGQVASIYTKPNSTYVQKEIPFYGNSRIGTFINGNEYHYELKDHLGNVRETIKVISSTPTWADSKSDYYPFGMKFLNVNSYRYEFYG